MKRYYYRVEYFLKETNTRRLATVIATTEKEAKRQACYYVIEHDADCWYGSFTIGEAYEYKEVQ